MKLRGGWFIISMLLLVLLWSGGIWQGCNILDEMSSHREKINDLSYQYQELQKIQEKHSNLEVYQLEVAKERERVNRMLPDNMEMSGFLKQLKTAADNSGMKLQELRPGEAAEEDKVFSIPLKVNLSGDYFSLLKFLRHLQDSSRMVQMKNLEVEQKDNKLSCQVVLKIFSEKV